MECSSLWPDDQGHALRYAVSELPLFECQVGALPSRQLDLGQVGLVRRLSGILFFLAKIHEPVHATAEAVGEFLNRIIPFLTTSTDFPGLKRGVLVAVLALVLLLPDEIPPITSVSALRRIVIGHSPSVHKVMD